MADPTPLAQTAVYMTGILAGYSLCTRADEWQRAWQTVREVLGKKQ